MRLKFYALDLETTSHDSGHPEYALQPWRVENAVIITRFAERIENKCVVHKLEGDAFQEIEDQYVWTWNSIFDIAEIIAGGERDFCSKIKWLDAMGAAKWAYRSQTTDPPSKKDKVSWSLAYWSKALLQDWEHYAEYARIKDNIEPLSNTEYWTRRCDLDTEATLLLGEMFWSMLTPKQCRGFLVEQEMLYPAALAWVEGQPYDFVAAALLEDSMLVEKANIVAQLGVSETILDSPKQLASLVYDTWCVPFDEGLRDKKSKSDQRPVNKGALTFLIEKWGSQVPQLALIREYRAFKTKLDKFVKGPNKCREYLGSDLMRHQWRVNSTYTGRCTVSSKCRG